MNNGFPLLKKKKRIMGNVTESKTKGYGLKESINKFTSKISVASFNRRNWTSGNILNILNSITFSIVEEIPQAVHLLEVVHSLEAVHSLKAVHPLQLVIS